MAFYVKDTVFDIWNTAHAWECDGVAKACFRVACDHFSSSSLWEHDSWDSLHKRLVVTLCDSPTLQIRQELVVWRAMVKWARANPYYTDDKENDGEGEEEDAKEKQPQGTRLVCVQAQVRDLAPYLYVSSLLPPDWKEIECSGFAPPWLTAEACCVQQIPRSLPSIPSKHPRDVRKAFNPYGISSPFDLPGKLLE